MSRMARSEWPFRRSRKAIEKRIANSSMASASRCRSRWGAAIRIAPNAAMMASSDPLGTNLASSSLIISDRKERGWRDASNLNWAKNETANSATYPVLGTCSAGMPAGGGVLAPAPAVGGTMEWQPASLQPASPHSPGVIARKLLLSGTAVAIALALAAAVWAQTGSPMMPSSPYTAPAASAPMKPNTSGAESLAATREKTVSCRPGR